MVHGQRPTIGVLYGRQIQIGSDSYMEALVVGLVDAARRRDCNLLISFAVASSQWHTGPAWPIAGPNRTFAPVGPWNTDGLIVINPLPAQETVEDVRRFQRDGHPLVYLGQGADDPRVVPDNRGGIECALEHLAGHGHRRIVFLSCGDGDGPDRLAAYEAVVRKLGLDADPALIVDGNHDRAASGRAIGRLVENGIEFTAVLASNGASARGALARLQELGIAVPDDVAVIGFDDFLEALATDPAMSCVNFPVERQGATGIDTLLAMIEEGAEPPPLQTVLTELVLRESCGCAPVYDGATGERGRRTLVKQVFEQAEVSQAVSGFAARLLATPQLDMIELGRIMLETLSRAGMTDCILGVYDAGADGDDPAAWSEVQIDPGRPRFRFRTRTFPPPELVGDDQSFQLIVLPLRMHDELGFIALPSDDISSCSAIVSQSEAAFESARNVMVRKEAEAALTRSEDLLRQAQKMEAEELRATVAQLQAAEAVKDEFLTLISHELRTPLTSIRGYAELLEEETLTEEQRTYLDVIDRNSARVIGLVEDLLLMAQIQSGGLPLQVSEVMLGDLITSSGEAARPFAASKEIELDVETEPGVAAQGDPVRLGQVLDNLMSNAIKYTPNGGGVAIRMTHTDETATIAVSDTGMGIPKDEQDQMFGRFFRASNAQESVIPGTGLGLAITRGIVEAHGGTIGFDSAEGTGTTFLITLPLTHGGGLESAA